MLKRTLTIAVFILFTGSAFGQLNLLSGLNSTVQSTGQSVTGLPGASSKISPDLQELDSSSSVDVIVQFNQVPAVGLLEQIQLLGGVVKTTFSVVNAALCTLPVPVIQAVAALPFVTYISPDRAVGPLLDNSAAAVNASAAWSAGWDGAGIGVAVIDSGITPHPDLDDANGNSRVVYSQSFVGGGTNDLYGHGTHVAGIVAGDAASSICPICTRTLRGIAPDANLINLRVLDQNGQGTDSDVLLALDTAFLLRQQYNIRVVNLSLGRPIYESYHFDPLCEAVEFLWQHGITVVVAAGNDGRDNYATTGGYGTIDSPGNDPYVITVGAMKSMGTPQRTDDLIASYSSKGPTTIDHIVKPDIVAPGNLVVSLLAPNTTLANTYPQTRIPVSYYENTFSTALSNVYYMLSGTSMATPVVSGAVADLLEAEPSLTPDQVKAKLMLTAYKNFPASSRATDPTTGQSFTSYYDVFTVGAGYLDIQAALADQNTPQGSAMSPTANYDSSSQTVTLSISASATWNTSPVWNVQAVWGGWQFNSDDQSLAGTRSVWGTGGGQSLSGTQSVWGTGGPSLSGTRSVWGTGGGASGFNAIWSTQYDSGTRSVWGTGGGTQAENTMVNGEN